MLFTATRLAFALWKDYVGCLSSHDIYLHVGGVMKRRIRRFNAILSLFPTVMQGKFSHYRQGVIHQRTFQTASNHLSSVNRVASLLSAA
jgi:hypothetical protein